MRKKIGCKKCGSRNYRFEKKAKGKSVKYYRFCNDCGKCVQIIPKRLAFTMYYELCKYEAAQQCQTLPANQEFVQKLYNTEKQLKKEYEYLYNNLTLFFDYILSNEIMDSVKNVAPANIVKIMKDYKNPLQEVDYQIIIDKLLETLVEIQEDKN